MTEKDIDGYFPNSPPSLLNFVIHHLLRSMEREAYLYKRLQAQGILNKEDIDTLHGLSDWQRIPTFEAEIRDKAIDHLNWVLAQLKKDIEAGMTYNERD